MERRIIGLLFQRCFQHIYFKQDVFLDALGIVVTNDPARTGIMKYDYFPTNVRQYYKEQLDDEAAYLKKLEVLIGKMTALERGTLYRTFHDIISEVKDYSENQRRAELIEYRHDFRNQLISFFDVKDRTNNPSYGLYLLIYLAATKSLPENFYFGAQYRRELETFNREVTCRYGVTSTPGIAAIISLASHNVFALFELGELYYYGRKNGPGQDIPKAYDCYKKAAGVSPVHGEPIDTSWCHPLALWALAYTSITYRQKGTELENCPPIGELEAMQRIDRVRQAIIYATTALNLSGNPAAANILGRIAMMEENELPGITELKVRFNMEPPEFYFTKAIEQGYVYGLNNMGRLELERIFTDSENADAHLHQYLSFLNQASERLEPWSANQLGQFYRTGKVRSERTGEERDFSEMKSPSLALQYYRKATDHGDPNAAWGFANMIAYYPELYIDNESLLVSHFNRILELSNKPALNFLRDKTQQLYGISFEKLVKTTQKDLESVSLSENQLSM